LKRWGRTKTNEEAKHEEDQKHQAEADAESGGRWTREGIMKSKRLPSTWTTPPTLVRSDGYLTQHGTDRQLDLFREILTPQAMLQVIIMLGLSDPKHLDRPQYAKIADILRGMGYDPAERKTDGKLAFAPWQYEAVEETGLRLRRRPITFAVREEARGRRKGKTSIVELAVFQEFGFSYEDKEGQPIDLDELPKDQLITYEDGKKVALYAIPMTDTDGNVLYNKDGTPRRCMANGVTWTFSSRLARDAMRRATSWIFFRDAVEPLRRHLTRPTSFRLMIKTLFWASPSLIEMSHDKMVEHLGIKSKDGRQVQAQIDAAFADMLAEGFIDKPVTIRDRNYYKPTKKTRRARRKDKVYQWRPAARFQPGKGRIAIDADAFQIEDGKPEVPKDGSQERLLGG